jgi:type IX secretion system PorP/SprF family membrane protein
MRKLFLLLTLIAVSIRLSAQQKPHYSQYILNQYVINPAIGGIENYTDVKLSYRNQWVGIQDVIYDENQQPIGLADVNPRTYYLTAHFAIGKSDKKTTATTMRTPLESPRGSRYWEEYTASAPHHGVGIQIVNDEIGPFNNFSAQATYAFHVGLSARTSLSAGFGMGYSRYRLDPKKLSASTNPSFDPALAGQDFKNMFDLSAGLYLYSGDYFLGLSVQQLNRGELQFASIDSITGPDKRTLLGATVPHFFLTAGYRFLVGEDLNIVPSILVKKVDPTPVQFETNIKFQYRDLLWFGGGFRVQDGGTAMAGITLGKAVNLSYAYNFSNNRLNPYTSGTHEILVGFMIGNREDVCPRNVW